MNPEALHLLSIARKGRLIEAGEEPVNMACRAQHGRLVLVASDASSHTFRRVQSMTAGTKQPWIKIDATKNELGMAIGFSDCAVAAITDVQLALAFVKALGEPVKYAELIEDLEHRVERVKQRRREEKAHRDNVRRHKVRSTPVRESPAEKQPEAVPAPKGSRFEDSFEKSSYREGTSRNRSFEKKQNENRSREGSSRSFDSGKSYENRGAKPQSRSFRGEKSAEQRSGEKKPYENRSFRSEGPQEDKPQRSRSFPDKREFKPTAPGMNRSSRPARSGPAKPSLPRPSKPSSYLSPDKRKQYKGKKD